MYKEVVIYIHNKMLAIKKNEILPFVITWMDLASIMPGEIRSEKEINTV